MTQTPSEPQAYPGPERRVAFFPRRLHTVRGDALLVDLSNGDRRSGEDRRKGKADAERKAARR